MKKIVLGAAMLLAAGPAVAQAAPQAPRDGIQTRAEAVERARAMFARVDSDRDGFITMAERQAVRGQARGQRMAKADPARRGAMFDRLDLNKDNMISRDEWARAEAMRAERRAQMGERTQMRGQRMAMRGAMLRRADTDRDQRVSLAEAEAAALQRFDRVDLNRDGRVTSEERQQLRQQWQQRRGVVAPTPVR